MEPAKAYISARRRVPEPALVGGGESRCLGTRILGRGSVRMIVSRRHEGPSLCLPPEQVDTPAGSTARHVIGGSFHLDGG
jgi:hypothetical protein